jgi:hypothetical protein
MHVLCGLIEVEHRGSLWLMPYICNDNATGLTDLQSIPIFASFLKAKPLLRFSVSSVSHSRARRQGAFLTHPDDQTRYTKEELNESSIFEHAAVAQVC